MSSTKGKLCTQTIRFQPVDAYDRNRLRSPVVPVQNMLLRQVTFPCELHRGDHVAEFWSNQLVQGQWFDALLLLKPATNDGLLLLDDSTDESFLALCRKLVGRAFQVTGGAAVLFTDPYKRTPVIRISAVHIETRRATYSGNYGPHVVRDSNAEPTDSGGDFDPGRRWGFSICSSRRVAVLA